MYVVALETGSCYHFVPLPVRILKLKYRVSVIFTVGANPTRVGGCFSVTFTWSLLVFLTNQSRLLKKCNDSFHSKFGFLHTWTFKVSYQWDNKAICSQMCVWDLSSSVCCKWTYRPQSHLEHIPVCGSSRTCQLVGFRHTSWLCNKYLYLIYIWLE